MLESPTLETPAAKLLPGLMSDDPAIVAKTEIELERLCSAGCPDAQRGGLFLIYGAWREGRLTYDDFAWRIAEIIRIAVTTDTLRPLFVCDAADPPMLWESEDGQLAEYVCVIDALADTGDAAGLVALAKIADLLPAEILDLGRRLRFLPPGRPHGVGAHDLFADLDAAQDDQRSAPPPLIRLADAGTSSSQGPLMPDQTQELYRRAAAGDGDAQSALVQFALGLPALGLCSAEEAICGAEMMARLAAASGRVVDMFVLAGVLLTRARHMTERGCTAWADSYTEEAAQLLAFMSDAGNADAATYLATLLSGLASEGDEQAGISLQRLADRVGPEVMQAAANFERLLSMTQGGK